MKLDVADVLKLLEEDLALAESLNSSEPDQTVNTWYEWGYEDGFTRTTPKRYGSSVVPEKFRHSYSYLLGLKDGEGDSIK